MPVFGSIFGRSSSNGLNSRHILAKGSGVTDSIGVNTRPLSQLQYIHRDTANIVMTHPSIVVGMTVTKPASATAPTVSAGTLTLATGNLWSFTIMTSGSAVWGTYEFATPITATSAVVFDTSGNGNHLFFSAANTATICLSGRSFGSDYKNTNGGEIVTNIVYPSNSKSLYTQNNSCTPAPIDNFAVAPDGSSTAWVIKANSTGNNQTNITIPADTSSYLWVTYVKAGGPGARANFDANGILSSQLFGGYYDFDSDTFYNMADCRREFCADGWIRLSRNFTNNGSDTLFLFNSRNTSPSDVFFWGGQLIKLSSPTQTLTDDVLTSTSVGYKNMTITHDLPKAAIWSDSMGSISSGYAEYLASRFNGTTFHQGGVGGETSTQIAARMLLASDKYNYFTIIHAGRNNVTDPVKIKSDIASMVAALNHSNFLVVSIFTGEFAEEHKGASLYNTITTTNAELSALYPNNYIDLRGYIVGCFNPSIEQDVIDNRNDVTPSSLRSDPIHLNLAGNRLAANFIEQLIIRKGWLDPKGTNISGRVKYNLIPISNPTDTTINDAHTYSLPDCAEMRTATGWTGVANPFYNADGTAKVVTGTVLKTNGSGPLLWFGESKWVTFKDVVSVKLAMYL